MSRKAKIIAVMITAVIALGAGTGFYLHNRTTPYADHSLNLSNVNTKNARKKAAADDKKKREKHKGADQEKLSEQESRYLHRVHNEGLTDKQMAKKYQVTPQIVKHGQAAAKQNIGGTLNMVKNQNYDVQSMADQYFNGETWGVPDLMGCLNAGMTPDYNSLKLTYYDGYVYQMSMNLNGPHSSEPYAKVTGYYISKTGQMQLKKTTLTDAGNKFAQNLQQ